MESISSLPSVSAPLGSHGSLFKDTIVSSVHFDARAVAVGLLWRQDRGAHAFPALVSRAALVHGALLILTRALLVEERAVGLRAVRAKVIGR